MFVSNKFFPKHFLCQIFKDYHGPLRTSPIPNIYAFFLFKQSGRIQLSEEWRQKLGNSMFSTVYNMSTAMEYLNLTGSTCTCVTELYSTSYGED